MENKNRIKDGNREQHLNLEQVAGHRIAYFTPLLLIQMEIIVLLLWLHLPGDFLEHIERRTRRRGIKEEKEQQKAPQMFWDWIYLAAAAASDADLLHLGLIVLLWPILCFRSLLWSYDVIRGWIRTTLISVSYSTPQDNGDDLQELLKRSALRDKDEE